VVVKVSLCMLVVACVKIPAFEGSDGGSSDAAPGDAVIDGAPGEPLVDVQMVGNGARATMRDYEMLFSTDGARYPHLLNLNPGPQQQFIMGGSEGCADEYGMGIALYPVTRVNGVQGTTGTFSIPLHGPYVGQVRMSWSTSFACPASSTGGLTGRTTFSFFPNGRMNRYDVVENASLRNAADCTPCGASSTNFFLASYTTLIVDGGAFLSDGTQTALDSYGEQIMPGSSACITERGHSIAFSWALGQTRMRVAAAPPTSQSRTIAFINDMHSGTTLPVDEWRRMTQMGISTETCGVLEPRITPFSADDHQLQLNGNPIGAALVDGIYGGDPQVNGYPIDFPVVMRAAPTIAPNIPAGFAVWLYHAPLPTTLTPVHSRNPSGEWYYEQRVDANSVVYWFNVSLEDGETITITGS
jgi:hypothetical protein